MIGLPTETMEDIEAIIDLVEKIRQQGRKASGKMPQININLSSFVPKPHTPFQWLSQASEAELNTRQERLRYGLPHKAIKLSWQNPRTSLLEATLSRGDRRLGKVIYRAWQLGCVFDAWAEHFKYDLWLQAFAESGLEPAFYAHRNRSLDEVLPWSHIDVGVTGDFLKREYERAIEAQTTRDCRNAPCNACGLEKRQPECREKRS